ncbi:Nucleolar complex-associated protein 3 [Erysiphe neolycopersici]|uniref:Nucleolar complex-associated protein 3 n=1 Tax=Erysiphe neolycopersici TaxID=212602 RepID=A0A420HXT1_9PEZI|nr:Nucleolar complex-associated protein 3 [Erysiphe neolycopersici]
MKLHPVVKKRKLSISLSNDDRSLSSESEVISSDESTFLSHAAKWNLEQDYENKPRKSRKKGIENTRLPIKTAEGFIQQITTVSDIGEIECGTESPSVNYSEHPSKSFSILEAKEELAKTALLLRDNDPEENVDAFKKLAQLGQTSNYTIKSLALMTQLAIYKDLIPGYRIRPLSKEDRATKVSKEVKKLRAYEQELVIGYQKYILELSRLANTERKVSIKCNTPSLASIAISCACTLLVSVPHFNFRGELIRILVNVLSSRLIDSDFLKCLETVEKLFRDDEDGGPSLDVVISLSKMMKGKGFRVDESVINLFLHLRILSEFSYKGSVNQVDKETKIESSTIRPRGKKVFRTKKERKFTKERKNVEQEFKVADITVSSEEKDRLQAETLKRVFSIYFRILKLRASNLMGAVLEGLASYAHLINQDFFGDLLEALKDLLINHNLELDVEENSPGLEKVNQNKTRDALLCIITAFALLEGQEVARAKTSLNLDLSFFIAYLYKTLYTLSLDPSIELSAKLHNTSQSNESFLSKSKLGKINFQTTTVLLLRSVSSILTPAIATQAVPPIRIAAFVKQLMTSCIQLPEKSCIAMTTLIGQVTKLHGKKIASLWNTEERRGDGIFDPVSYEVEASNPFATTIWEGELLKNHFSPAVRSEVKLIEKNIIEVK